MLEAGVAVVKRVGVELRDICLYTGVCVRRGWAERRVDGSLGKPNTRFDIYYDPSYLRKTTTPGKPTTTSVSNDGDGGHEWIVVIVGGESGSAGRWVLSLLYQVQQLLLAMLEKALSIVDALDA